MYKCHCDCGKDTIVKGGNLTSGNTKSCGCLEKEVLNKKYFTDLTNQSFGKLTVIKYVGRNKYNRFWECKCECGNKVIRTQTAILSGHSSCGCQMSIGESIVASILKNIEVEFFKEYTFDDCVNPKSNTKLRFDFYLPSYNCCIEYDGKQHYGIKNTYADLEGFKNIQYRDYIKNQYCVNNKIKLIRIPYTQLDNLNHNDIATIIKTDGFPYLISYSPMITRMLEAFDKYDRK